MAKDSIKSFRGRGTWKTLAPSSHDATTLRRLCKPSILDTKAETAVPLTRNPAYYWIFALHPKTRLGVGK